MRVAILGGTRFIGHWAAVALAERGHEVTVMHRGEHPSEHRGLESLAVEGTDATALHQALQTLEAEAVVDTRAMTVRDAEVLCDAVAGSRAHLTLLSSIDVYAHFGKLLGHDGNVSDGPVDETGELTVPFPFRGLHPERHDYDKKLVESAVAEAVRGERIAGATVLRLPMVYGPRDYQRRFGPWVDAIDDGRRLFDHVGGARWRATHAHVHDVAHAIALSVESPALGHRVFNVGERETPTMKARFEALASWMGSQIEWREGPTPTFSELGDMPCDVVIDSTRIRDAFGTVEITDADKRWRDVVQWSRSSREQSKRP